MNASRRRSGFTITEMLISMVVLSIVLAGTTVTLMKVQQQYTAQRGTVEAREQIRSLEVMLAALFRTSGANPRRITYAGVPMRGITIDPLTLGIWNNIDFRADFNPVDSALTGDLERVHVELRNDTVYVQSRDGGNLEPVAAPVSELLFQFETLEGTPITDPALVATTARRVRMTIAVRAKKSSSIVRRESWIAIRN
jgi:prepilin-type N-terminal cleavage/methylation domain-containing protein